MWGEVVPLFLFLKVSKKMVDGYGLNIDPKKPLAVIGRIFPSTLPCAWSAHWSYLIELYRLRLLNSVLVLQGVAVSVEDCTLYLLGGYCNHSLGSNCV